MKRLGFFATLILLCCMFSSVCSTAWGATDGYYSVSETPPAWEGTDGATLENPTTDYNYTSGDESEVSYTLPWTVSFYGQTYSSITADTNGNIWFTAPNDAYSYNLATTGSGPVIAAWNSDLSSNFYGGAFIQHKTNPERMVIEWQTETYTEEGLNLTNDFEVVIYPDGRIRHDYKTFNTQNGNDSGSGISKGDGSASLSLTTLYGNAFTLAGRSFLFSPQSLSAVTVAKTGSGTGMVTGSPSGIACGSTCVGNYAPATTLTLTATPDFGSTFDGWSGACSGAGPCTININGPINVSASFSQTQSPVVVVSSPSGTIANNTPILSYIVSTGTVVVKVDGLVVNKVSGAQLDMLSDGPHVVRVEATNSGGYLGFSESSFTVDTAPPIVSAVSPAAASSNVPVRTSVLVQFSTQVDPSSVTANTATLVSQGIQVQGSTVLSSDGNSLIFQPQTNLAYATTYTFTLKAGVRDLLGNTQKSDQSSTFSTPVVDPGLVGYWPMDGDWKDYSVNADFATAYGTAAFTTGRTPGVSSASFAINSEFYEGSGGFVPASTEFIPGTSNTFSISFWVNPNATRATSTEETFGGDGTSGQRYAVGPKDLSDYGVVGGSAGVSVGTNGISVIENTGTSISYSTSGYTGPNVPSLLVYDSPVPLSGWNHVVVVFNNKQPSLYLNGAFIRTGQTSTDPAIYPAADFGDTDEGYGAFSGQMGEVAIYNRALSAQEIQTLYQGQSQVLPQISITSPGQSAKYKPGDTGSATVSVSGTVAVTGLYCSASGATTGGSLVVEFTPAQSQTTQQFSFDVSANAAPYAPILLSCVAQTANGALGVVDLQLQAADLVPPTVVSSIPANNAIDVSATMPITITFSEAMDPASIVSRSTFKFQRTDNGAWITGMFRMSPDNTSLTMLPSPALDSATSYTVILSGVRDLAGNVLASDYNLQFTTLQQTSLAVTNQGTAAAPYVLPTGRYGTVNLSNSYVTAGGEVTVDALTMANSTLNVNPSAAAPGNLSVAYGDLVLTDTSQVNVNGTLNLSANLSLTSSTVTFTGTGTISGNVILDNSAVTTKSPVQVAGSVTLQNASVLTHYAATTTDTSSLDLTAASMSVDATSKIDASGKGYLGGLQYSLTETAGRTVGNATSSGSTGVSGGSYGGMGGSGQANITYGDLTNPNDLGSGGSGVIDDGYITEIYSMPGNSGGGLIRLKVGALLLNGTIAADGAIGTVGGGSGGGIRIDADSVTGTGRITANGGDSTGYIFSSGGGGGGGRIAVYCGTLSLPAANLAAAGGRSENSTATKTDNGGAGTIYLQQGANKPDLTIDNGGLATGSVTPVPGGEYRLVNFTGGAEVSVSGTLTTDLDLLLNNTQWTVSGALNVPGNLSLTNSTLSVSGNLAVPGNLTLNNSTLSVTGDLAVPGDLPLLNSSLNVTGNMTVPGNLTLDNSTLTTKNTLVAGGAITLQNQSVLTHFSATTTDVAKLDVTASNITIDATSKIDVTGKGYLPGGNAPAAGWTLGNKPDAGSKMGSGGSYGGVGGIGQSANAAYGDLTNPNDLGSGGSSNNINVGSGGSGGGLVRLSAGSLTVNGSILADGFNSDQGAGSGGAISIQAGTLAGAGTIAARGGAGNSGAGGGGGGRIAVYYSSTTLPAANILASGGTGAGNSASLNGGAGTIYLKDNAKTKGDLIVNNGGIATTNVTAVTGASYEVLDVQGGAISVVNGNLVLDGNLALVNTQLTVNGALSLPANLTLTNSTLNVSGALIVPGNVQMDNSSLTLVNNLTITGNLVLNNGSVLSHYGTTTGSEGNLNVLATAVTIDGTSKIDASGKGYLGGLQNGNDVIGRTLGNVPDAGSTNSCSASYGGLGGPSRSGGTVNGTYGDLTNPSAVGSGGGAIAGTYCAGPGGNGGGNVRLQAGSLTLNGTITVDGMPGQQGGSSYWGYCYGGSGSGGSIQLNVGALSGLGSITARGGASLYSSDISGAGGGRIAIYYDSMTLPGTQVNAAGGASMDGSNAARNGGAGTIFLKDNAKTKGDVILDNSGIATSYMTTVPSGDYEFIDIEGGAQGATTGGDLITVKDQVLTGTQLVLAGGIVAPGDLTLDGSSITVAGAVTVYGVLTLKNGSVLTHAGATTTATYKLGVTATSVNIDATSKIDVSGKGYLGAFQGGNATGTGMTHGNTIAGGSTGYSGGSYGSMGGYDGGNVNASYDIMQLPGEVGSGGGTPNGSYYPGGNGGGLVQITAGTLNLSGSIVANGTGGNYYDGAGSGGGILLQVGMLSGTGAISANGGGGVYGGGGGGGRIAIYYDTNTLSSANVTAIGGVSTSGASYNGGAGTIYLKDNAKTNGDVIVSNGGVSTNSITTVAGGNYGQVSVTGGAEINVTGNIGFGQDVVFTGGNVTFNGGITTPGNLTLDGSSVTVAGAVNVAGTLALKNGSALSHNGATTTAAYSVNVTAASVSIDATSKIDVSGKGYLGAFQGGNATGTGMTHGNTIAGGSTGYSGGSYGGMGGYDGGNVSASYGIMQLPGEVGSGGGTPNGSYYPGGNGGGLVQITAGTLNLFGSIVANGTGGNYYDGAGSGGGILLQVGTLSGTGAISANGGGAYGGGGGGGRIAIYYNTNTLPSANVTAAGGSSSAWAGYNGAAGTVYFSQNVNTITVSKAGTGTGTVQSTPAGISCGATCSAQFGVNSSVTLTAAADIGSTFSGWSGNCSGMGVCTVTMNAAQSVTAAFAAVPPPTVTITGPSGLTNNNKPVLLYNVSAGTVVVKVDGVVVNKVSGSALDTLSDGSHQIQVTSTNSAGGVGSATTTVVIDTAPPALSVGSLATPVRSASLTLAGTVESGAAINISSTTGAMIGQVSSNSGNWSCAVSNLAAGLNTFTVTATDLAGNTSTANVSTTYIPPVAISLTASSIAADYLGTVGITVTNIAPSGSTVLIEQYVDTNHNGIIDCGDFPIRSFQVTDGTVAGVPNTQGDEDGTVNGSLTTTLNYFLTNDLYHAPGNYIFRVTSGAFTASTPFAVTPVSQAQTVSGLVSAGTNTIPGALIRLEDKWQRPVAWSIADGAGNYVLNISQPGSYYLTPILYGYVAPATPISIAAGQNLSNQSLTLTPGTNQITGTVIDAVSSAGIGGVWVQAKGTNNTAWVITGADGSYDLMLPAGQYAINTLGFATVPGTSAKGYTNFDNHPLNVSVAGNAAGNTIALSNGNVQLSGQVLDQTGSPVQGLPVTGKIPGPIDVRMPASYAVSNASGAYSLDLFAGSGWNIGIDNNAAQSLGYLGTVSSNLSTSASPLTGQNLTVKPITAWIQGTVTDSTNKLLPGVEVQIHNADSSVVASVFTAIDGSYSLGAYAGTWYLDALTATQGLPAVPEQTVVLNDALTAINNFIVDVTPPSVTITSPSAGTISYPKPVLAFSVSEGTVVVSVDGVVISKQSGDTLDLLANGQHTVQVQATDTLGSTGTAQVTFNVNYTPPAVITPALPFATTGAAYSQLLMASGGITPYTWSIANGALPANLTLNPSTGTLSGTPTTTGTSSFTVRVTDVENVAASSAPLSITTYAPLSVSTTSLSYGYVSNAYSQALGVTGGMAPYAWIITSGALPAGISLNAATGALTGAPTFAATGNSITFQVTDANGSTAATPLSIVVYAVPAVSSTSLPDAYVGSVYNQTLAAAGGNPPFTWSLNSGTLPNGLGLNIATGAITGTPTAAGTGTVTFKVKDSNSMSSAASSSITIAVDAVLAIGTSTLPDAYVGTTYSQTLAASGGKAPYVWSITSGALPTGLGLNASTGAITGTPTAMVTGSSVTFQVTDANSSRSSTALSMSAYAFPVVSSTTLPDGYLSTAYSQTLAVTGGKSPYTWTLNSGTLPAGLTLNSSTGAITGTPTATGTSTVTFKVKDANSLSSAASSSITIAVDAALTITTASLPDAYVGTAYSQALAATGGKTPYTWTLSSGTLPTGLSLNASTGAITGTATAVVIGNSVTFQVTDANSSRASTALSLSAYTVPSVSSTTLPDGYLTTAYSQTLAVTGGKSPYTWTLNSGTLPAGLTLNSSTGAITGTPTATGTSTVTFKVKDANSTSSAASSSITIAVDAVLTLTTSTLPDAYVVTAYSQTLAATGGRTPYTWSVSSGTLPTGLSLNASTGAITGTATAVVIGNSVTFQVTDANSSRASTALSLSAYAVPVVSTTALPDGYLTTAYSQTLVVTGGKAPYTWGTNSGTLPAGLTLNSSTGSITGTPTATGTSTVTFKVKDANSISSAASSSITIAVDAVLTLTTSTLPDAYVGTAYSQTLAATGGRTPYTWSVSSGTLPTGLSINASTGAITGTATAAASPSSISFKLTDASAGSVTKSISLAAYAVPVVSTTALPDGYLTTAYSQTLVVTGGKSPYTWSTNSGTLPAGLTLNSSTGAITGTPTATGTSTVTFKVKDANSISSAASSSITIAVDAVLTLTTSTLPDAYVGTAYSQTLAATGGRTPYTWSVSSGTLPTGLSLNASTGAITGTATAAASPSSISFKLTDASAGSVTKSISLAAYAVPVVSTTALPDGYLTTAYSQTLVVTGGKSPYTWSTNSGTLPAGLTLNSSTGAITGTPTATGTSTVTFKVKDANSTSSATSSSITIVVDAVLTLTTSTLPDAYVGTAYSQTLAATGGRTPYTWSVYSGTLPTGLSLNASTGTITGTPTATVTGSSITFQVADANAVIVTKTISMSVYAVPVVSTATLPDGYLTTAYSQTLAVTGGKSPFAWSISSGALPAGLTLNSSTGAITGTPTTVGAGSNITFQVKDADNTTATKILTINVNPALVISTASLADVYVENTYNQTLAATGGKSPYTWSITTGTLPAGISLNASTGAITGTPTTAGTSNITVKVADANAFAVNKALTVAVYTAPAVSTTSLADGYLVTAYSQTLAVTGGKSPFTWSVISGTLPAGLSLNSSTGAITGTPTAAGAGSSITFQVKDADNTTASTSLTISVNAALAISTSSLPSGIVGTAYSQTMAATGGKLPYTWSITSGTLPAGLGLNAFTGALTGTPTATVTGSSITFQVADANAVKVTKVLTITISSLVTALDPWTNIYTASPNNTSATNLAAGTFTVSSGTSRVLLVSVVMKIGTAANPTISATYGGTALTQIKVTANTQKEIVWVGYLNDAQIGSGSKALAVTYSGATGNAGALHVKWASFSGANQTTPVASSGATDTNTTSATFGSAITYVINGITTVVAGNGGTPATGTLSATPAFTAGTATTTNTQTSITFTTTTNTTAGSYASTTPVSWSGTTGAMSGLVVVSLQP